MGLMKLFGLGNGKARVRDDAGQELMVDGQPVEVELPEAAAPPAGGTAPHASAAEPGEVERLRAENDRLRKQAEDRDKADREAAARRADDDGKALADRLVAADKITPAMKGAVSATYAHLAKTDPAAAAKFAKDYEDAPALGLQGRKVKAHGAPAPEGDGTPPAGTLPAGDPEPDPVKAKGLDRDSLRATLAATPDGRRLLGKLDAGEMSWDALVAPVVAQLTTGN